MPRSITAVGAAIAAAALLAPAAAHAAPKPKPQLLVSLGDSYASGFQPTAKGKGSNTRNGFAYQVPKFAAKRGYDLKLVNFGCGGATTKSLIATKGCAKAARGPGGEAYSSTQATAAVKFLKANRKRVGVITVSIGGNDVTKCAGEADAVTCVGEAAKGINTNLKALLKRLRAAAGPKVRIVGITYPDVILGAWLTDDAGKQLAGLSQIAFKSIINPALKARYEAVGGSFVDVTDATGGYDSLDTRVSDPALSAEPVPANVKRVCDLTFYCQFGDIHARTEGYALIAELVAKALPRRKG